MTWRIGALTLGSLLTAIISGNQLLAQPMGGFAVVLDKNQNFTDSPRSLAFYDIDNMAAPLFNVFIGNEAGGFEDPNSLTVDPITGNVYVLAFDSGTVGLPQSVEIEDDGDMDGNADFDLFRVDFAAAYSHWQTNFQGSGTYVSYGDGSTFSLNPAQHPNPQSIPVITTKIGEIGRSQGDGTFFDSRLEFLNSNTLLYVDSQTGATGDTTDVQIRAINRIATSPGGASGRGTPGGTEGGYNNNTTESWESTIIGHVGLDGASTSEIVSIAAIERDGVRGMWIQEDDGSGDQVAFFEITNLNGTSGNAYRTIDFATGSDTRFTMDNNPSVDDLENLGSGSNMLVDRATGDLVLVETGFFDVPTHQGTVYKLAINSYNNAGGIDAGAFSPNVVLNVTGVYDDTTTGALLDDRNAIFDWVNNDVYFFDEDASGDTASGGIAFSHDWYKLDLDTGLTTAVGPNADLSNGLFDSAGRAGDQVEFFSIGSNPVAPCDLDGDSDCDATDLRQVYDNIAGGTATNAAIATWLADAGVENNKTYLAGDTDLNGAVGGSDFTALASNFGGSGLPGAYWDQGNFDGNAGGNFGVGGGDFTALAANFGSISASAVPEPGLAILLLPMGGLLMVARRRRR